MHGLLAAEEDYRSLHSSNFSSYLAKNMRDGVVTLMSTNQRLISTRMNFMRDVENPILDLVI